MDFLGSYNHTLDAKNRIFIPSKYREYLGDTFVLCPGADKCIYGMSEEGWESFSEKIKSLSGKADVRRLKRQFYSAADRVETDKQGRVTIKVELLEYAGLTKDIVIVGSGSKFEIWDAEAYEADMSKPVSLDDYDIGDIF